MTPILLGVGGPCMEPGLPDGAETVAWPGRPVRVGDVVALRAGPHVMLHRVVARVGDRLVHQGDRGVGAGVARLRDVIGHVDSRAGRFRRSPPAWLLTLGLLARFLTGIRPTSQRSDHRIPRRASSRRTNS